MKYQLYENCLTKFYCPLVYSYHLKGLSVVLVCSHTACLTTIWKQQKTEDTSPLTKRRCVIR